MKKIILSFILFLLLSPLLITAEPYTADGSHFNAQHSGQCSDGTTCAIAGYVVYCGITPDLYTTRVVFNKPGLTFREPVSAVVSGSGDFSMYCAFTAFGDDGLESPYGSELKVNFISGIVQKTNPANVPAAPFNPFID